eukprot:4903673-Lingulodinium_polyedra.AAC.1
MARRVLLGVACHSLWSHIAPADWRHPVGQEGQAVAGDFDEVNWHTIHAWRVRKTHEYSASAQ